MRLMLIRHGQTPNNVTGALDTGFPGAGLTALGQLQAEAVPEALARETIHGVYASPLQRTQLTAAPLAAARGLRVGVTDGLEEVSAGDLEMRNDHEAVHAYVDCLAAWMMGGLDRRMPGGETGHDFLARYANAIRDIGESHGPDDTVAVFSHGAAIRAFSVLAAALEREVAVELSIPNTGMGILRGQPDATWALEGWVSHPLGGPHLAEAESAHDVTGESAEEVALEG